MPNPQNVIGKGNRFSSTNQPAVRGRKPTLYKMAKKAYNISLMEYKDVERHLIQCTKGELKVLKEKEDTPIWVANICEALIKDTKYGRLSALKEIEERLFGKVPEKIEAKTTSVPSADETVAASLPEDVRNKIADILQQADFENIMRERENGPE